MLCVTPTGAPNSGSRSDMVSLDNKQALSLLIVEDDKAASSTIQLMVAKKFPHLTILVADDGKAGLELFKEHKPDVVITDINMPEMDGIEMAGRIKALKADIRFIVITAYSNRGYFERFSEIGFSDYLMKPLQFPKLFAAIERCLAVSVGFEN